jgi:hypothetical protein
MLFFGIESTTRGGGREEERNGGYVMVKVLGDFKKKEVKR